jgi:D-arginine dehydrogenase
VLVVGGGVAGLSALVQLAADGRAMLLEREPLLCAHASGRNAAIYRPLEEDESTALLARRSLSLLSRLCDEPVLARTGLLLATSDRAGSERLIAHGRAQGVACELLSSAAALRDAAGSLDGSEATAAVFVPDGGVLDIHRMTTALARSARARSAQIRTGAEVARVLVRRGRVEGVALGDGTELAASAVVLAAGAWGARLGEACGASLPLVPVRRHLVQLDPEPAATLAVGHPVVWRVDDEVYYRPEGAGVLASPCDQTPFAPGVPQTDSAALELLAHKLARTAPRLAQAKVRAAWACLRTFAPDRELCVGEDPRVSGLYWFAGLGGRGMGVAPAAGEVLVAAMQRAPHALALRLSPSRLCAS